MFYLPESCLELLLSVALHLNTAPLPLLIGVPWGSITDYSLYAYWHAFTANEVSIASVLSTQLILDQFTAVGLHASHWAAPILQLTSISILILVMRWKGSSRKDMKGSLWHLVDSCRRRRTPANTVFDRLLRKHSPQQQQSKQKDSQEQNRTRAVSSFDVAKCGIFHGMVNIRPYFIH